MTTITPSLFSGQYYQMPATGSSDSSTGSNASDTQGSAVDALLQALDPTSSDSSLLGNSSQDSSSQDSAYMLDLSPQAQSLLDGTSSSGGPAGISSLLGSGNGFPLSSQQQQQISAILAKYQNAPFTQATFDQIQSDLKAAGLSPDQLAAQNEVLGIQSTDSSYLLDALDGDSSDTTSLPDVSSLMDTEQSNANAYMQQLFSQWQGISTTAGSADSTGSAATSGTSLTA